MKHFLTVTRHYAAVAFLLIAGLGASGCADSATVNPVVELAGLTVTPGTLQPTFHRSTTQYSVDLTSDIASVTISAQPAVSGDSVTINGVKTTSRTIPLGPEGSTTSVSIVVSESTTNSRTYTVLITRAGPGGNNSLQNLIVSPGPLAPAFNANELIYTVNVGNTVESVEVTPILQDPLASVTVNEGTATSGQAKTINLNGPGQSTPITLIVTAQNGNQKPYLITVNRGISGNNLLQSLAIAPGTLNPTFNAGTAGYSVNVASNVDSVLLTPTLQDTTATMTVNGTPTTSEQARSISLSGPGSNTFINVNVTAQSGSQNNYVVVVARAALGDNNLSALTVSPGSLIPSFAPNTTDYTVNVATDVDSLDVSATKALSNAVMTGDVTAGAGIPTGNATISLNGPGTPTNITINVTAPNGGTPKTYTITINRAASSNNNLSALSVTSGALNPTFEENTTAYIVNVATDVDTVTVSATKSDPNAVMLIGSVTVPAGTASGTAPNLPLGAPGSNTLISILVTAQNGVDSKTYTVTVHRAASDDSTLSALSIAPGSLDPSPFDPNQFDYTVNVDNSVASVVISATKSDPQATMSALGSVIAAPGDPDGQILVNLLGATTEVVITVIAQDMTSQTSYKITVNQAPELPFP